MNPLPAPAAQVLAPEDNQRAALHNEVHAALGSHPAAGAGGLCRGAEPRSALQQVGAK